MTRLVKLIRTLARGIEGQDLTEYALLVTLIALAAVGAIGVASGHINALYNAINIPLPAA